jgi:hypothetical protein
LGPSSIGPLRGPTRMMPYVVLCTVLLAAVVFSRARYPVLSRNRLLLALFITGFMGYLGASRVPQYWRVQLVVAVIVCVGLGVVWWLLRKEPAALSGRTVGVAAGFVGVFTVGLIGVQHHYAPDTYAFSRGMPGDISTYQHQDAAVVADTFMVGNVDVDLAPGVTPMPLVLIANAWYVNGRSVQNVHANTGYLAYSDRYCMNTFGLTCPEALPTLLSTEPTTGLARVDLLSVSSLVLLKPDVPAAVAAAPPAGWHIADQSPASVIWVRDHPMPTAGGVAWHTPGLDLVQTSRDDTTVHLKIGAVPPGGGDVVFSRIAWPGYQAGNATVAHPVDDYLLTVHVSPDDANKQLTIHYQPPHWTFLIRLLAAALLIGLAWSLLTALTPRRRRHTTQAPDGDAP